MKFFLIFLLICLLAIPQRSGAQGAVKPAKPVNIKIYLKDALPTDSFRMEINEHSLSKSLPDRIEIAANAIIGIYSFQLKSINKPVYISLFKDYFPNKYADYILQNYLAEPGDDIRIDLAKDITGINRLTIPPPGYQASFSGKGAAKYQCNYETVRAISLISADKTVLDTNGEFITGNYFDKGRGLVKEMLNKYKAQVSSMAYAVLTIDLFSSLEIQRLEQLTIYHSSNLKDSLLLKKIINNYRNKTDREEKNFPDYGRTLSINYPQFILDKISIGKYRGGNSKRFKDSSIKEVYREIKKDYCGELRDKVLTLFTLSLSNSQFGQEMLEDILSIVHTNYCLEELNSFANTNSTGKPAYNFALPDTSGKLVKLNDFKGKVVFIDFWFNGCSGCAHYYSKFVSKAEEYFKTNPDVIFITISVDINRKKWLDGINSGKYTSPAVINLNTNGKGEDHPIIKNYRVSVYPRPLLIDREGKIFTNNDDELRSGGAERLTETINKALAAKATKLEFGVRSR